MVGWFRVYSSRSFDSQVVHYYCDFERFEVQWLIFSCMTYATTVKLFLRIDLISYCAFWSEQCRTWFSANPNYELVRDDSGHLWCLEIFPWSTVWSRSSINKGSEIFELNTYFRSSHASHARTKAEIVRRWGFINYFKGLKICLWMLVVGPTDFGRLRKHFMITFFEREMFFCCCCSPIIAQ